MFKSLQRLLEKRKSHQVLPSDVPSCMELGVQPESETPPLEISITVSTADNSSSEASRNDADTSHSEQAEELRSNEMNPNDVENKKPSCAGLEMLLNVDYYLGLSPFRLSSQGKAVSCCANKAMFVLMNVLAMMQVFVSVRYIANLMDKDIRRKDDIFLCITIGQQIGNGLLLVHYFYMLWSYQEPITNIIRKLNQSTWASDLQQPLMVYLPIGLRLTSFIISFSFCFSGLNILSSFHDWSFSEVLFDNAVRIILSFPASYYNDYIQAQGNATSNLTTGVILSDSDTEVSVFVLVAVIIFICVQQLHIKVKILRELDEDSPVDWQTPAQNLVAEHNELQQICLELNEILNLVLPYINVTSIVSMSGLLQVCLRKSWIVAVYISVKLIQTWVIYMIGVKIANKATSFKLWFISQKTVNVLQIGQKQYHAKLEEINMIPLGIGTDVFYTHVGFIASLFGVVLTYFFLATDAISDSR